MSKRILETNEENLKKQIWKELQKSEKDIIYSVGIIEDWIETQPHIPEKPSKTMIYTFLQLNKFSIERTKQKLDMYYTIRNLVPEIFCQDPVSLDLVEQSKIVYYIPLPKLTDDYRRVIYSKLNGDYPVDKFNHENYLIHAINITEVLIQEEKLLATHFILDCEFLKTGHVPKFSPMVLKKGALILEIQVHKTSDALFDYFPKSILPEDCGGQEDSLASLNELWLKKLKEYKPRFEKLAKLKVNEDLRPSKLINDEILGYYGNFKKIEVD